ncbi:hypothetical protein [Aureimonas frigidaquae]|uniref:Glutamyl-tRNA(Gln) amidotransferase subunit A, mitochondrial n=1 Tax=Aureimonas frigidaquae TaxID=424757 RepID=A0A0P0Z3X2_9HYPH|nr:hypothetical protein [Aureimonas frigidaquae]BAT28739.1 glutamyl-tRNA(Gln) amidotransferase subunit A, mitochondrial [Aureimonas frigidaquae]
MTLVVRDVRIDVMNNEASINLRGFDVQKRYASMSVQLPISSCEGSRSRVEAAAREEAARLLEKAVRVLSPEVA